MTPDVFNIALAFTLSLLGSPTFCSHLMSTLLCLECLMLSFFITPLTHTQ